MRDKPSYKELEKRIIEQKNHIDKLEYKIKELIYLAVVLQNSNDTIIFHDFSGNITLWSKVAQKMYGWPESQALNMNIKKIIPPEKAEGTLEIIRDIAHGKEIAPYETKRITADGRILNVLLTNTALVNEEGLPFAVATFERDITGQKQSLKEKNEFIKELQKINSQLQKVLSETKTLRGIIPICMICKQIRNDKGFWEQVEVYVHNHSEADFSHGICPKCIQEKFPKVYKKMLLSAPKPRKMLGR
jgi:PAS domain S-box-containing protein